MPQPGKVPPLLIVGGCSRIGRSMLKHSALMERASLLCRHPNHCSTPIDLRDPGTFPITGVKSGVALILAGVSDLAQCAKHPDDTGAINVEGVLLLSRHLASLGWHVVYMSSAAVFSGLHDEPSPRDPTDPISEYGRQRARCEELLQKYLPSVTIVRPTKVVDAHWDPWNTWLARLAADREVSVFDQLIFSPLSANSLVEGLDSLIHSRSKGIWHFSGAQDVDYWTFVSALSLRMASMSVVAKEKVPQSIPKLRHASLDCTASFKLNGWGRPSLSTCIRGLAGSYEQAEKGNG